MKYENIQTGNLLHSEKQINEQNKYFTKETETFRKNQTGIVEMKNSIKEVKNEPVIRMECWPTD